MIAFGCAVVSQPKYSSYALPGIRRGGEPDSPVLVRRGASIQEGYNSILEELAGLSGLEAAVLLHEDVEILDEHFAAKIRRALEDPLVAVVGAIGASEASGLAWWEGRLVGRVLAAGLQDRDSDDGWSPRGRVDTVDGLLMVLSPWAVRTLRFDEDFAALFHGYDADLCLQARARRRRVVVEDLEIAHHYRRDFFNRDAWVQAEIALQRKWFRRWPRGSGEGACAPARATECPTSAPGVPMPPPRGDR